MQDHDRDKKDGKIYVVGNKPVKELLLDSPQKVDFVAFRKGRRDQAMEEILELCRTQNVPYKSVGPKDLDYMYRGNHQGVAARCAALDYVPLEKLLEIATEAPLPLIVALDQVQDTGNVGVLARTVHALGGAGLIVCQHHGAYIGAGAVRSSAGALTQLPVAKVGNLANAMKDCVKLRLYPLLRPHDLRFRQRLYRRTLKPRPCSSSATRKKASAPASPSSPTTPSISPSNVNSTPSTSPRPAPSSCRSSRGGWARGGLRRPLRGDQGAALDPLKAEGLENPIARFARVCAARKGRAGRFPRRTGWRFGAEKNGPHDAPLHGTRHGRFSRPKSRFFVGRVWICLK